MSAIRKNAIATGAARGIGAAITSAFLARDYTVVANARSISDSAELTANEPLGSKSRP